MYLVYVVTFVVTIIYPQPGIKITPNYARFPDFFEHTHTREDTHK